MRHPLRVWSLVVACSGTSGALVGAHLHADRPEPSGEATGVAVETTPALPLRRAARMPKTAQAPEGARGIPAFQLVRDSDALSTGDDWWPQQLLVRASTPASLDALADALGAGVVHSAAVDGLGVLMLPEGLDEREAIARLMEHPQVVDVSRHGIVRVGPRTGEEAVAPERVDTAAAWHFDAMGMTTSQASARTWVAVLDTGLAYASGWARTASLGQTEFMAAPSLLDTPLVDPWDYLRQAPYPLDEHQQGTHVTSLIAGRGAMRGLAPGAAVLPYKVIDAWGLGTELALIDALYWSAWADVDVVHMGLSLSDGYHPSEPLLDALGYVDAVGAVMVAAAGDHGDVGSTWPAASPLVVSVGAMCRSAAGPVLAPYSNDGADVDLLAPGGCLDRDVDRDGLPDGVLAESFSLNDPTSSVPLLLEGTGQAAAMVTGGVVRLLEAGAPAQDVRAALQAGAAPLASNEAADGVGTARIDTALDAVSARSGWGLEASGFGVMLTPWRKSEGSVTRPAARILVVDKRGRPVSGARVYGHFRGTTTSAFSCETNRGTCDAFGEATAEDIVGWSVTVAAVSVGAARFPPKRIALADEETVMAMRMVANHLVGSLSFAGGGAPMGRRDGAATLSGLGEVAPAFVFEGGGDGRTHPFGLVVSPQLLGLLGVPSKESVGTGQVSNPIEVSTIVLAGGHTLYAIHADPARPGLTGTLAPSPGASSCLGQDACALSVVLASGATVGTARRRAVRTMLGEREALFGLRAQLETWTHRFDH